MQIDIKLELSLFYRLLEPKGIQYADQLSIPSQRILENFELDVLGSGLSGPPISLDCLHFSKKIINSTLWWLQTGWTCRIYNTKSTFDVQTCQDNSKFTQEILLIICLSQVKAAKLSQNINEKTLTLRTRGSKIRIRFQVWPSIVLIAKN